MRPCSRCGGGPLVRNRSTKDGFGSYCHACNREINRAALARNGGSRRYHLRKRYGIEPEEFDAIVASQGGVCMICNEGPATHLDHNHETGAIRGALCVPCNNGLGLFRDNPDRLLAAAAYLLGSRVRLVA